MPGACKERGAVGWFLSRVQGPAFSEPTLRVGAEAEVARPQATCALHEVASAPASGPAVLELYPQLFVALLLRVSCTVGVQPPRQLQAKERRSASSGLASRSLEPCR